LLGEMPCHGVGVGVDTAGLAKEERAPADDARLLHDAPFRRIQQDGALEIRVRARGHVPLDPAHAGPTGGKRVAQRRDAEQAVEDDEVALRRRRRDGCRQRDTQQNCLEFHGAKFTIFPRAAQPFQQLR